MLESLKSLKIPEPLNLPMAKTGVLKIIGDENVFLATPQLGEAMNQAVAVATARLNQPSKG